LVLTEPRYEQADEMHGGVAAVSLHVANLGIATPFPRELSTKDLQLPGHPEIFVIGDTAALPAEAVWGAVQVGMLRELTRRGVSADFVVGSSVGAINASYFASAPNPAGIEKLETIWRALR
jgi:hypothetical protein